VLEAKIAELQLQIAK
jgi:hypothetical protein